MTSEDTSRTTKPTELSLSEEVQEAKDICQSLHSADLNKLMQAVKTVARYTTYSKKQLKLHFLQRIELIKQIGDELDLVLLAK